MLDLNHTRLFNTESRPVLSGHVIAEEGVSLVFVKDGIETKVRSSTGAAGEAFAGFSQSRNIPPTNLPNVEDGVVGASLGLTLSRLPIAGQIGIAVAGTQLTLTANAPIDGTEVQIVADTVTFHASHQGSTFSVLYQYEPTVSEAKTLTGDMPIGGLSSTALAQIGLITYGDVSTNLFDAAADWSAVIHPNLGTNGELTVGGTGTLLKEVTVLSVPTAGNPMLNLRVKV